MSLSNQSFERLTAISSIAKSLESQLLFARDMARFVEQSDCIQNPIPAETWAGLVSSMALSAMDLNGTLEWLFDEIESEENEGESKAGSL